MKNIKFEFKILDEPEAITDDFYYELERGLIENILQSEDQIKLIKDAYDLLQEFEKQAYENNIIEYV